MTFRQWLHWFSLHLQGRDLEARIYVIDINIEEEIKK